MNDMNTYCYIQEETSCANDYNGNFGYKIHDRGNRFYLTFDAILQSFGVLNRNKRMYEATNIMNQIETSDYIQSMLKQNQWQGEIDHPAPIYNGDELTITRMAGADMKYTSHYIRTPTLNGNLLNAHIQTDSGTKHGMNMAIKIVDGKIIPGFSARVFGSLKNKGGQPVVYVNKLITYDWVAHPSHKEALGKITQPLTEAVNALGKWAGAKIIFLKELAQIAANSSKETEWLCESFGLNIDDVIGVTSDGNSVVIQENTNTYVQPLTDKRIKAKTKLVVRDWLNN